MSGQRIGVYLKPAKHIVERSKLTSPHPEGRKKSLDPMAKLLPSPAPQVVLGSAPQNASSLKAP